MKEDKEKDWRAYVIVALAALAFWYFQTDAKDIRTSQTAGWQEAGKTREYMLMEMGRMKENFALEAGKIKERLAHVEGFHEAEKLYKK